jgi:hypothetical protein
MSLLSGLDDFWLFISYRPTSEGGGELTILHRCQNSLRCSMTIISMILKGRQAA